jgi:hypothetical protein
MGPSARARHPASCLCSQGWADIADAVMDAKGTYWMAYFVGIIVLSTFFLMNVSFRWEPFCLCALCPHVRALMCVCACVCVCVDQCDVFHRHGRRPRDSSGMSRAQFDADVGWGSLAARAWLCVTSSWDKPLFGFGARV